MLNIIQSYQYYHVLDLILPQESCPAWKEFLFSIGSVGIEELKNVGSKSDIKIEIKSYFEDEQGIKQLKTKVQSCSLPSYEIKFSSFGIAVDHHSVYEEAPVLIGSDFEICPPSYKNRLQLDSSHSKKRIYLKHGAAFGTGLHPTTGLVSKKLLQINLEDKKVLDIGTGTGILAILVKLAHAKKVDAVEISSLASELAKENFALNEIEDITLYSQLSEVSERYSLIVANIMASTLIHLKEEMKTRSLPGATLLFSGILESERKQWLEAYRDFEIDYEEQEEGWCLFYGSFS